MCTEGRWQEFTGGRLILHSGLKRAGLNALCCIQEGRNPEGKRMRQKFYFRSGDFLIGGLTVKTITVSCGGICKMLLICA